MNELIVIEYGPNVLSLVDYGLNVSELIAAAKDALSCGDEAEVYLNGQFCLGHEVARAGDRLTVMKPVGRKGGEDEIRRMAEALENVSSSLEQIKPAIIRIADHFDPRQRSVVGTPYIAERLGVSVRWINDLIHKGEIPKSCICPQSGEGKYWRFWKEKIDLWIEGR